jgi:hypothetical protein
VNIPEPKVGLVICYAYLWRDEAKAGLEEGRKDRPCVIVIATENAESGPRVVVAPITHRAPSNPDEAIEMPRATKVRLRLDAERSWVVASDLNQFTWPGVDLRPTRRGGSDVVYGFAPATLVNELRSRILSLAAAGRVSSTTRTGDAT